MTENLDLESTRALARIVTIEQVQPIPNTDHISYGTISGTSWVVVVGRNIISNQRGVYIEIDSKLPQDALWLPEKLRGQVLKTTRIRGVLSQGLFVEEEQIKEIQTFPILPLGTDVSRLLNIYKKRDPLECKGSEFCTGIENPPPKTDEPRVQNVADMIEQLQGKQYFITLKYDGMSSTYGLHSKTGELVCNSRNYVVTDPDSIYCKIAKQYDIHSFCKKHPHLVLQGEIVGPTIQKNPMQYKENRFFLFSVWDRTKRAYLDYEDAIYATILDFPWVLTVERGFFAYKNAEELLQLAKGCYPGTDVNREGLVIRPEVETKTIKGDRLSFKVINNDFLEEKKPIKKMKNKGEKSINKK